MEGVGLTAPKPLQRKGMAASISSRLKATKMLIWKRAATADGDPFPKGKS